MMTNEVLCIKRRKFIEEIKIKYFTNHMEKFTYIAGKSDRTDLRASKDAALMQREFALNNGY